MSELKIKRDELKMTQSDLALACDVSQVAISKIERGLAYPSLQLARKIAKVLGCSIDELFP